MLELGSKIKKRIGSLRRWHIIYAMLVAAGLFLVGTASLDLIGSRQEYAAARAEYDYLRGIYLRLPVVPRVAEADAQSQPPPAAQPNAGASLPSRPPPAAQPNEGADAQSHPPPEPPASLPEINPDFVGWITIEGFIDYPVVRGRDNDHYLHTTFTGRRNPAGSIFMDYRNVRGFDEPVCIIYGHNMRDGSMFASLHNFLDQEFLTENQDITITTPDGEILLYRVFAAKLIDGWDRVFGLGFYDAAEAAEAISGAPEGASRFMILSTCTTNEESDERLLVFAEFRG